MTVFGNSNAGYLVGKQVFPVDYETEVSQRLVDAAHNNDLKLACEWIADSFVDVNFVGTVSLKAKKTEIVLHGELAHEVRVEYEEFKTEVTALFLAAHSGNLTLVRKLLVNDSVFFISFRIFVFYNISFLILYNMLFFLSQIILLSIAVIWIVFKVQTKLISFDSCKLICTVGIVPSNFFGFDFVFRYMF